jgi:hypothetical protein
MQHKRRFVGPLAAVAFVAVLAVAPAASAPPAKGLLVPGRSLGGVSVGMTKADVLRVWGSRHGVCRDCPRTTWYFNYEKFVAQGAGVVFEGGHVSHVFTVWSPDGWRSADGLALGASEAEVDGKIVLNDERLCDGYDALLAEGKTASTVYYLYDGRLWGFGLTKPGANPCL